MKAKVLHASSYKTLENNINTLLEQGWKIKGNMCVTESDIHLMMIKDK